ncbi:2-isopropylmalate synthase [Aspergillus luchuensis]|uniref:2-isopropylmalate synthase n=1 Tax=Aspergillus kawachii TaxID=1069201 RepID=A0A146F318_ASPKA|nr:2-isopropylmalate synthase [Aspergillus luchuensis]
MDPVDLGREHEAIVRVNSQSGKGGVAWLLKERFDIDMPRDLEIEFTQVVKAHANISGFEVTRETIFRLFREHYIHVESERFRLLNCRVNQAKGNRDATYVQLKISVQGSDHELEAPGGDLLPTILDALRSVGYDYEVLDNQLQYIASQDMMTSFVRLGTAGNIASWGVGMHKNTDWAVSQATLSMMCVRATSWGTSLRLSN